MNVKPLILWQTRVPTAPPGLACRRQNWRAQIGFQSFPKGKLASAARLMRVFPSIAYPPSNFQCGGEASWTSFPDEEFRQYRDASPLRPLPGFASRRSGCALICALYQSNMIDGLKNTSRPTNFTELHQGKTGERSETDESLPKYCLPALRFSMWGRSILDEFPG